MSLTDVYNDWYGGEEKTAAQGTYLKKVLAGMSPKESKKVLTKIHKTQEPRRLLGGSKPRKVIAHPKILVSKAREAGYQG